MHFPSDSWGKFTKEHLEDTLDFYTRVAEKIDEMERKEQSLEVADLPIYNPKTGEKDYVDITLVDKILINSMMLKSLSENKTVSVEFKLSPNEIKDAVLLEASTTGLKDTIKETILIPLDNFEAMLFKAINEVEEKELEKVEDFHAIRQGLVESIIQKSFLSNEYLVPIEEDIHFDDGIGIIEDTITNDIIGTFETLTLHYLKKGEASSSLKHLILLERTMEDLTEKGRYEFYYHSVDLKYSISLLNNNVIVADEDRLTLSIHDFTTETDFFDENHALYEFALQAKNTKNLKGDIATDVTIENFDYEEFRKVRLTLLEESRERKRKEAIKSQFSDIEIDF